MTLNLAGSGAAGSATVQVEIDVGGARDLDAIVAFVWEEDGEWQAAEEALTLARASENYAYSIELTPRTYYVLGTIDEDQDGELFEEGERTGFWRNLDDFEALEVEEGETLEDVSFDLLPLAPIEDEPDLEVGGACTDDSACPGGVCVTDYPGGYCTLECSDAACPVGSRCYRLGTNTAACLATCTVEVGTGQGDCRPNYVCYQDSTGSGYCQPSCIGTGLDCASGVCDASGFCR
ncbi:hypothetical protein HPC49_52725 [Pyxidicoccus fallax]|nr:hypothetical protein [Pyxidicoccus fallax]